MKEYAESSPSIGTALNPYIGYEVAAEIIKESTKTGRSIREVVKRRKLMTDEELDRALDVAAMTRGGIVVAFAAVSSHDGFAERRSSPRSSRTSGSRSASSSCSCSPARVDARRGDPLGRRHGQPGLAVARRLAVANQPADERAPVRLRQPRGTSGRSSSRSCCSAWVGCSRSTKASRSCATRTSSRTSGSRSACLVFAIVLESHGRCAPRSSRRNRERRARHEPVAASSADEDPRAPRRAARGHRRARSVSRSRCSA